MLVAGNPELWVAEFYVLLTVHIGTVLVNNQIDAQFYFLIRLFQFSLHVSSTAHHQESQLYQYDIWYMSPYIGNQLVCRLGSIQACIPDGHIYRMAYTRCRTDTIDSPDDEYCSKHVERTEINI